MRIWLAIFMIMSLSYEAIASDENWLTIIQKKIFQKTSISLLTMFGGILDLFSKIDFEIYIGWLMVISGGVFQERCRLN